MSKREYHWYQAKDEGKTYHQNKGRSKGNPYKQAEGPGYRDRDGRGVFE